MGDVTQILSKIEDGDPSAAEGLLPLIYDELRALASAKMADESPDNTLQATALVHEAYIRLVDVDEAQHWNSRGHFFGAAAEAMRRILVDQARHKETLRAGGKTQRVEIGSIEPTTATPNVDLLALDEALEKLEHRSPRSAALVKLRFFAGLSVREAAATMGIAPSTVVSDWAYAKGWLGLELSGSSQS